MKKQPQSSCDAPDKQKPGISILSILVLSLFIGLIAGAGIDKSQIVPIALISAVILFINRHKIAASDATPWPKNNEQQHNAASTYIWPERGQFACAISAEPYQGTLQQLLQENIINSDDGSDPMAHILQAQLIPDNSNPYDSEVVRISIHNRSVGYLSRKQAHNFLRILNEKRLSNQITLCNAIITKNDATNNKKPGYGVKLDIEIVE